MIALLQRWHEGDLGFVGKVQIEIVRQVLFNQPAYRVRPVGVNHQTKGWVVDGCYITRKAVSITHGFTLPPVRDW